MILGQAIDPKNPERLKSLTPAKRAAQLEEFANIAGPRVLIVNYEQVDKHLTDLNKIGFDIVIYDEAHYLKNPQAKRTKACHRLRGSRYFLLTGTPMLNQVHELWSLLHLIDPVGYPKFWTFKNRYCVFGGFQDKQVVGVKNEKELLERLNSVMIRRLKSEVLDLPEVQYIIKKIDLSEAQKKLYDRVMSELEIPMAGQADPSEIENALTKLLRLKQICGTTLAFTGVDDSAKLDMAVEDAVEILSNRNRLIVFTQFRDVQEAFCDRLDKAMPDAPIWELNGDVPQYDRQPYVRDWSNHTKAGAIVCMLQVAGVGLNMTAARHMQFLRQALDSRHEPASCRPLAPHRSIRDAASASS